MTLRLTSRIALYFLVLAALLLAAVVVLAYQSGSAGLKAAAVSEMIAIAVEKESSLDTWIGERLSDVGKFTHDTDVVAKAEEFLKSAPGSIEAEAARITLRQELEPHLVGYGSAFVELQVLDPERGIVLASTNPSAEGKIKASETYFSKGKRKLFLSAPNFSAGLDAPVMIAAVPLRAADGRTVAVLAARLDLDTLTTIAQRRTGMHETEECFLVDAERFFITQPRFLPAAAVLRQKADSEDVRSCVALHQGVIFTNDYRGVPSIVAYRWNAERQLGLIAKIDQAEALAPVRAFGRWVTLVSVVALFVTLGVAIILARTVTRPLRLLQDAVGQYARGDLAGPGLAFPEDEIGLLAREFKQMATCVAERTSELFRINDALRAENGDRRRAEESLRLLNSAVLQSKESIVITDADLDQPGPRIVFINPAFTRMTGYEAAEVIGKTPRILQGPRTDRAVLRRLRENLARGEIFEGEAINYRKDGTPFDLEWQITPLRDAGGKVTHFVGTQRDVTVRKAAQTAVIQSNEKFHQIADNITDAFWIRAADLSEVHYVSPAYERIWGRSLESLYTHPQEWSDFVFPDDRERVTAAFSSLTGDARSLEIDYRIVRPDGEIRWVHVRGFQVRDGADKMIRHAGIVTDITDRKSTEGALRESEERRSLQSVALEAAANGVVITDRKGIILWVNRAFTELTGYSVTEAVGQYPRILKSGTHAESYYRGLWKTIAGGNVWKGEIVNRHKDGHHYHEEMTITPVRGSGGTITHFIAVKQDIGDRKRAEASLQVLNKERLELSRQAGMAEVATGVLHNVGNVLNSVNVSALVLSDRLRKSRFGGLAKVAKLLNEQAHDLPGFFAQDARAAHLPGYLQEFAEYLRVEQEAMIGETNALRKNIEHIKDVVAMQQSYAKVSGLTELIEPAELIDDALRMSVGSSVSEAIEWVEDFDQGPPIAVDKHKVLLVLINFLRNAKYACEESGRADQRIIVRVTQGGGRVRFSVTDNGVGIPAENLKRIFNHGFTTRKEGHGFGLHSGANAAAAMGGSVTAHSDGPGQGATFTLELPCEAGEDDRRAEVHAPGISCTQEVG